MTESLEREGAEDFVRIFVGDTSGPKEFVCFFEDTGETGDLYVSNRRDKKIVRHLQIYVDQGSLGVAEGDVEVVWSSDGTKCGVMIWGEMRGIIDMANGSTKAPLRDRKSPPIIDPKWLEGF